MRRSCGCLGSRSLRQRLGQWSGTQQDIPGKNRSELSASGHCVCQSGSGARCMRLICGVREVASHVLCVRRSCKRNLRAG